MCCLSNNSELDISALLLSGMLIFRGIPTAFTALNITDGISGQIVNSLILQSSGCSLSCGNMSECQYHSWGSDLLDNVLMAAWMKEMQFFQGKSFDSWWFLASAHEKTASAGPLGKLVRCKGFGRTDI